MSSVMISSQSFTPGAQIASAVADRLGHELLDDGVYRQASERFGVAEADLRNALQQRPTLLGMSDVRRRGLAVCVQAALATRLVRGDIVVHGPFSGLMLRPVAHILQVRVTSSLDARVAAAVKAGVERSRAARRLQEDDGSAEVIARAIFGANDGDERYDLVVDLGRVSPQAAAEAIAGAAANERYQPTSYSRTCLKELEASHRLAARLAQELELDLEVTVYQGAAKVRALAPERKQKRIQARAESLAQGIDGVTTVEVLVVSDRLRPIPAELR